MGYRTPARLRPRPSPFSWPLHPALPVPLASTLLFPILQLLSRPPPLPQDGGDDEEAADVEEVEVLPEAGMRKSARTEHIDFKAREEER